jgi:uncharacterized protein DUF6166
MSYYEGRRTKMGAIVTVDGETLDPRLDLRNHSPTGFDWGYCGSGPAQLALAILADHCDDMDEALEFYQRFKWAVIAELPKSNWTLNTRQIDDAIERRRRQEAL